MITKQKIIFTFNQFYIYLIKELKEMDPTIKSTIKKNYKTFDKLSEDYSNYFWSSIKDIFSLIVDKSPDQLYIEQSIENKSPIQNITFSEINKKLSNHDKPIFYNYIFILTIFAKIIVDSPSQPDKETSSLYTKCVEYITNIEKGISSANIIEDILDDDTKKLLEKLSFVPKKPVESNDNNSTNPADNIFKGMENSKIVNLAKEISENIDVSNIKLESPDDIYKMMDFSDSNNMMGDIIKKVSSTVSSKINSGELRQEDLLSEATSMLGSLKGGAGGGIGDILNNPMFSELMKGFKKGRTPPMRNTGRSSDTRDRLRKKLEDRKNKE